MFYKEVCGEKISKLGLGMMRLPKQVNGEIDEVQLEEMIKLSIEGGINYFDTAYPYHEGKSELMVGKYLTKYPRDSYYLADKYPGHQIAETYNPAEIFEEQLKKCNVEYFDFYLLHNVTEMCFDVYTDPKWGIVDYFVEQKKLGRIKHLGFSCHAYIDKLEEFLQLYGDKMEFCQIQFNYLDWTLQNAKTKYDILVKYNTPIWVMEPLHGGQLADNPESAFRWIERFDNIGVILSGMSNKEQLLDNLRIFNEENPLDDEASEKLLEKAEGLKKGVPCTGCGYCQENCPMGLHIPRLLAAYNDAKYFKGFTPAMYLDSLDEDKKPSQCLGCGACAAMCPQKIDIPEVMKELCEMDLPNWRKICEERAAAAAANKE